MRTLQCPSSVHIPWSDQRLIWESQHAHNSFIIHACLSYGIHCYVVPPLVTSQCLGPAAITLLRNGELDTLALGKADPWLFTANDAVGDSVAARQISTL